ncbi:hypothetical protein ABIC02_007753 [Bradyrhizobium sp. RT5a]
MSDGCQRASARHGYSLQANNKTREGGQHIDRDAQFQYINTQATTFLVANEPVISVDTKKKELVGNFKNNGREWRRQGRPELVNIHDFIDPKLSRAVRYGVYDITNNVGWVSVGTDHDTASFAVNAIRRWWPDDAEEASSDSQTPDDHGRRRRQQRVSCTAVEGRASKTGGRVQVADHGSCRPAPASGTRSSIVSSSSSPSTRGKPLRSYRTIVQLIAAMTTHAGLKVCAELDE